MPLPDSLAAVERDIASGDLGKARDRLHGLISTYPADLSLRRRLGGVYASLQDPSMAGRYWYLEAVRTPDMQAACGTFERSCGGDPLQILRALKYRADVDAVQDAYAGQVLRELEARVKAKHPFWQGKDRTRQKTEDQAGGTIVSNKVLVAGCILIVLVLILVVIGTVTVLSRLFG